MNLADRIIDEITKPGQFLDMGTWYKRTACGTVACLAGWACLLRRPRLLQHHPKLHQIDAYSLEDAATEIFYDEFGAIPDFHGTAPEAIVWLLEHASEKDLIENLKAAYGIERHGSEVI